MVEQKLYPPCPSSSGSFCRSLGLDVGMEGVSEYCSGHRDPVSCPICGMTGVFNNETAYSIESAFKEMANNARMEVAQFMDILLNTARKTGMDSLCELCSAAVGYSFHPMPIYSFRPYLRLREERRLFEEVLRSIESSFGYIIDVQNIMFPAPSAAPTVSSDDFNYLMESAGVYRNLLSSVFNGNHSCCINSGFEADVNSLAFEIWCRFDDFIGYIERLIESKSADFYAALKKAEDSAQSSANVLVSSEVSWKTD